VLVWKESCTGTENFSGSVTFWISNTTGIVHAEYTASLYDMPVLSMRVHVIAHVLMNFSNNAGVPPSDDYFEFGPCPTT